MSDSSNSCRMPEKETGALLSRYLFCSTCSIRLISRIGLDDFIALRADSSCSGSIWSGSTEFDAISAKDYSRNKSQYTISTHLKQKVNTN